MDVTVVNRGEIAFEVEEMGLMHPSGNPAVWALEDQGRLRRRRVAPGESVTESFNLSPIPDHWVQGPLVGAAKLVSGEWFFSGEPEEIHPWALARIRRSPDAT